MGVPKLPRVYRRWTFVVAIGIEFAALTWLASLGPIPVPLLWVGYAAAFLAYVSAVVILRSKRVGLPVLFLIALIMRLPWLTAGLSLSDDAWRYLHDGRSQVAGVNPYRYAPNDPRALVYAGPEHPLINNPDLPTIYPPAAQLAFRSAIHLGGTLLSWKILVLIADLAVGVGLAVLLKTKALPTAHTAVYLLHPLPIIEFAGNAHVDVLGICALVFSLVLLQRRTWLAGAAYAVSAATKYLVVPLFPFYLRDVGVRHRLSFLAAAVVAAVVLYLPLLDFPSVGSLNAFARSFEFNGPVFLVLRQFSGPGLTRVVLLVAVMLLLVGAWVRRVSLEDAAFIWVAGVLLLSPIVHPWYVTWLIPFLTWRAESWALVWTGTIVASYYVLTDWRAEAVWHLPALVMVLEYLPVYGLLVWRVVRRKQAPQVAENSVSHHSPSSSP